MDEFEQRLSRVRPHESRDIRPAVLAKITQSEALQSRPSAVGSKKSWAAPAVKPFWLGCCCAFLLGMIAMYSLMQHYYELEPKSDRTAVSRFETTPPQTVWSFDDAALTNVRQVGDSRLLSRSVAVVPPEKNEPTGDCSYYNLLRQMQPQ